MSKNNQLSAEATKEILEAHYNQSFKFWSVMMCPYTRLSYTEDEVTALALLDIAKCKTNPFKPKGEPLDSEVHAAFLNDRCWYTHYYNIYVGIVINLVSERSKNNELLLEDDNERALANHIMAVIGSYIYQKNAGGDIVGGISMSEWYAKDFGDITGEMAIRHWIAACGVDDKGEFVYTMHGRSINV